MIVMIRNKYENHGVDEYYSSFSGSYFNPHLQQVKNLISRNILRIPSFSVLDLCCGNGEVTNELFSHKIESVIGCDPYMHEEYTLRTGKECFSLSFRDIAMGRLTGIYTSIICSFALHLCEQSMLPRVIIQLKQNTDRLIVISPLKRPFVDGLIYEDFDLTSRGKKVFLKIYDLEAL